MKTASIFLMAALLLPASVSFASGNGSQKTNTQATAQPGIPSALFSAGIILNLPSFDAPEEMIYEPLPGETFLLPDERAEDAARAAHPPEKIKQPVKTTSR